MIFKLILLFRQFGAVKPSHACRKNNSRSDVKEYQKHSIKNIVVKIEECKFLPSFLTKDDSIHLFIEMLKIRLILQIVRF